MTDAPNVAVCICTYRRPEVVARLLDRLVEDVADVGEAARVGVVVVDDDRDGSAAPVLDRFADRFELGLHGVVSGAGNISRARNLALDTGRGFAEWLAIVDDDCLPDVGWLGRLLAVQRREGADCVSGACVDVAPPGAPRWLTEEPFLEGPAEHADGARIEIGHLKNTLLRSSLVGPDRVRFRDDLGTVGGEDATFFHDLHRRGMVHVFARDAVVREQVPIERATLGYQLRRAFWYGNSEAVTTLGSARSSRGRLALGGVKRAAFALRWFVPSGRGWWWRHGLADLLRGVGRIVGALGVRVEHR